MRIAYLGPKGTFSEEAALLYFKEESIEPIMYTTIVDVLEAVNEGQAEKGIVPIENALEGTITMTTDGLVENDLWIEGEAVLPVRMQLLGVEGATIETIKEVWSIAPALTQCRNFTKKHRLITQNYNSTAGAAESLRDSGRTDAGAYASAWAAQTFGLDIIAKDVHDNNCNQTRFLIVSKNNRYTEDANKSMVLITPTEDRPGLLAVILNVFSSLGINLSWIESRPTKKKLGTYRFFIEAKTNYLETNFTKAVAILETYGYDVRILGSYGMKEL